MQCSDLKHCDTDLYENTRICTAGGKPDINQDAIELQTTEEHYEHLRFVSREGSCRNINEENKTKVIQWKDVPTQIRYSIYALSLMMTILYIAVITAAVLIHVIPKSEDENNSVDKTWTLWSVWSNCDATCNNGTQTRLRFCNSPLVSSAQLDCEGSSIESRQCQKDPCPVDRTWTLWSVWSNCDATCDKGTQTRLRFCYSPFVSSAQLDCEGSSTESRQCLKDPCPDDRTWTLWSVWSNCDATCDNGIQRRLRFCYSPFVPSAQLDCEGSSTESRQCQKDPCPVDRTWTLWSVWSNCDATCDKGTQTRLRFCYSPFVSSAQLDCDTVTVCWFPRFLCYKGKSKTCISFVIKGSPKPAFPLLQREAQYLHFLSYKGKSKTCVSFVTKGSPKFQTMFSFREQSGGWSNWGSWGSCSESCGGGIKSRLRTCSNPRPTVPGKGCDGSSEKVSLCNKNTCDDHKVSFLAKGTTAENSSNVIKFPSIMFNSGNGYNSRTGRFTCKIPGIYNFAVTLTKVRRDIDLISATLRINGDNKLKLYSDPSDTGDIDYGSYSLSVTGNFHLGTNDYVDVNSVPNHFINDYRTSFTGVLVIPDN